MIDREEPKLSLVRQCALLGISRSSLYYLPTEAGAEDMELMALIDQQYLKTPFYGSRRMTAWLRNHGHQVNRKRVRRLMRLIGLEAIYRRPNTSKPNPGHKVYPYLLRGLEINRVNQVWATDIAYIPMARGFLYLVAIMDWHSRYVLAWRLSNTLEVDFCVAALEEALSKGRPQIFNTDQGSQFTSEAFTSMLLAQGVQVSMDGRGRCMDNVFVERLWRSIKYEEVASASFTYQWVADDTDISGATGATYTPVVDDIGKAITVTVSFTDDAGNAETLTSAATDAVEPGTEEAKAANSPATGAPAVTGTAQMGETLTVDTSGIADADGMKNAVFAYQWVSNDGNADTDIQDAAASTYTLVDADIGRTIKVRVSFTDDAGNEESLTSAATDAVAAAADPHAPREAQAANTPATGAPTITGAARVGETLAANTSGIADEDGLENAVFSYQWLAGGADISGATGSTYLPVVDDAGRAIGVRVSFTDDDGNEETLPFALTARGRCCNGLPAGKTFTSWNPGRSSPLALR